jgi:hypothetical protein
MPDQINTTTLDLDALEREGDPGEFTAVIGGRQYSFNDAQGLDYRVLLGILDDARRNDLAKAIGALLSTDEDRTEFFANQIPTWKLGKLFEAYQRHFGLTTPGERPGSS